MKRFVKMLSVTCVAALALAAVAAAGAQAAPKFTASATGTLTGTQTNVQVFTTSAGGSEKVTCKKAHTTGNVIATEAVEQEVTVAYSECTADTSFGNIAATVSNAEYNLKADGEVNILNTITIHVGGLGQLQRRHGTAGTSGIGQLRQQSRQNRRDKCSDRHCLHRHWSVPAQRNRNLHR